jgi:hypothetical protein
LNTAVTEHVGTAVMLLAYVQDVPGLNLGQDMSCPDRVFLCGLSIVLPFGAMQWSGILCGDCVLKTSLKPKIARGQNYPWKFLKSSIKYWYMFLYTPCNMCVYNKESIIYI